MENIVEKMRATKGFACLGPVTEEAVVRAEQQLGVRFASEYREYVMDLGVACIYGHELTGITVSKRLCVVDATRDARTMRPSISKDLYLVEDAHIDGILIWQREDGGIYLTQPGQAERWIAPSLAAYLRLED